MNTLNQAATQMEFGAKGPNSRRPKTRPNRNWTLYFDGGCHGNPGAMYGSYEARDDDGDLITWTRRTQFGHGTNNEAEWGALQFGLESLFKYVANPPDIFLTVYTDSMIVRNRLMGKNRIFKKKSWHESSVRMFERANRALEVLNQFGGFIVKWQPRERNVERFGH